MYLFTASPCLSAQGAEISYRSDRSDRREHKRVSRASRATVGARGMHWNSAIPAISAMKRSADVFVLMR
jgi:hypothetical protein